MTDEPVIPILVGSPDPLALSSLAIGGMIGATGALAATTIPRSFEWLPRWSSCGEQIAFIREFILA